MWLARQEGYVSFLYLALGKLALKIVVGGFVEGNEHDATGSHVETMDYQRSVGMWIFLHDDGLDRLSVALAWHAEHAFGFAYDNDVAVAIQYFQLSVGGIAVYMVGLYFYSLEHPVQDRFAATLAGWIVVAMLTDYATWRFAHPHHSHEARFESLLEGVLQ